MPDPPASGPVWLVLPTYDEAANIEAVVAAAFANLPPDARVLVVDDASPDGTGEIADRIAAAEPRLAVIHRPAKQGLGPAYIAGFRRALDEGAGVVAEMDADFSHDPGDLPRLLAALEGRADLAIGSRYVRGGGTRDWSALRRLVSRSGSAYARWALGLGIRDLTGGFRCYRREVLTALDLAAIESKGYAFQVEVAYRAIRAGFRAVEVPIVFRDRTHGESKMSASIAVEAVWRVPHLRYLARSRPSATPSLPLQNRFGGQSAILGLGEEEPPSPESHPLPRPGVPGP